MGKKDVAKNIWRKWNQGRLMKTFMSFITRCVKKCKESRRFQFHWDGGYQIGKKRDKPGMKRRKEKSLKNWKVLARGRRE